MYRDGNGISVDKVKAACYFKMASDEGHVKSMIFYAEMLKNGEGIQKNLDEAAWHIILAEEHINDEEGNEDEITV